MSLTSKLELPDKPRAVTPWLKRPLLAANVIRSAMGVMAKTFNALEAILLFEVLISGFGELFGRGFSWGWYGVVLLTLSVNAYLRITAKPEVQETK